jgi:hypothetical protein
MSGMARRSFSTWSKTVSRAAGAAHPPQRARVAVLQGHVQVGIDLGLAGHDLDQLVGDVAGVGVHQPHPAQPLVGAVADGGEQPRQAVRLAPVAAIVGGILRHDHQLSGAGVHQRARLVHDCIQRAAAQLALETGDGAEGARRVAAVGNLEIGAAGDQAWARRRSGEGVDGIVQQRGHGGRCIAQQVVLLQAAARTIAPADHPQQFEHVHPAPGAEQPVDFGHAAEHFGAVALHQAAGGDQHLMLAFAPRQFVKHADGLFLGGFEKAAGVDDQHVGVARRIRDAVIGVAQQRLDAVAVDLVLRAAQSNQVILHSGLFSSSRSQSANVASMAS